jgi:putative spermidine/putrescine transport system ATP-binding protein
MNEGVIAQLGTAQDVFNQPRTPFVARFMGGHNVLPGDLLGLDAEYGALRRDRIRLVRGADGDAAMPATIRLVEYQGAQVQVHLAGPRDQAIDVHLSDSAFEGADFAPGAEVTLSWRPQDVHALEQ